MTEGVSKSLQRLRVVGANIFKFNIYGSHHHHHHHRHRQSVLPMGMSFTAGTKVAVLSKDRSSTANSGTYVAVLLGINRWSSFPMLSAPHSSFSIWSDLKRSEKIPGAPTWRWGDWMWLTGFSGFHRNSPQRLNISFSRIFDLVRDPEIPMTFLPPSWK